MARTRTPPGDTLRTGRRERARGWYATNQTLVWICVLIAVNQLGFGSIVPVVPLYAKSFGVSKTAIGLTIAIYGLARFLMNVPTAALADRYGRRSALAAGGAVTVLGNLICALSGSYWMFLGGRFVAGAGAAMVLTGTQVILVDISTRANRGRLMSIYMGVFLFAVGIGPLPGGLLAEHVALSAPFYAYVILGSVVALLGWLRVPETRGLRPDGSQETAPAVPFRQQLRVLLAQTGFLMISAVSFCQFFARTGALFNLIPSLGDDKLGLSAGQIGFGLSMISIVGLLLAYPSGVLVDRFGRKAVIVPATLLNGAALTLFGLAGSYLAFIGACAVWAVASGIASAAPGAYAADMAPPGMNAQAMGIYRMLADFGYVAGPLLLGSAADIFATEKALYGTAGMLVIAGALFAIFAPETHRAAPPAAISPRPSAVSGDRR